MEVLDDMTLRDLEAFVAKVKSKNKAAKQRRFSQPSTTETKNQNVFKAEVTSSVDVVQPISTSTENIQIRQNEIVGDNQNQNVNATPMVIESGSEICQKMDVEENITASTSEAVSDKQNDNIVKQDDGDNNHHNNNNDTNNNLMMMETEAPLMVSDFSLKGTIPQFDSTFVVNRSNVENDKDENMVMSNDASHNSDFRNDTQIPPRENTTTINDDNNESNINLNNNYIHDSTQQHVEQINASNILTYVSQTHSDTESDSDSKKISMIDENELTSNNHNNNNHDSFY
jgi:hypothetical protein